MNTTMTERFGVAGALLVKLFGRYDDETDELRRRGPAEVRDIGVRTAMYSRVFFVAHGRCVGAVGAAVVYLVGGHLVLDGAITLGTLVALGTYVVRLYAPIQGLANARVDVMTAFVSFDRVFEVLDTPSADRRPTRTPSTSSRPAGRIELDDVRFRYPAASDVSISSLEDGRAARRPRPASRCCAASTPSARARPARRPRRAVGRGQDDARVAHPPPLRRHRRCGPHRRPRRARPHPGVAARGDRRRQPGPAPLPRHGRRQPALRPTRTPPTPSSRPPAGPPGSTTSSPPCPRATTPSSASGATGCRAARSSGSPSPACCSRTPRIVVLDEATSHLDTENEALVQQALADALARAHVDRHRPPAVDHRRRRPDPRARRGPHRRAGPPRRAPRRRRPLRRPVPHPRARSRRRRTRGLSCDRSDLDTPPS